MASLKAFLPDMAKLFGTTADALYTRQRALAELGVLKVVEGRGPGSGTPLDGSGVAAIIIALLAADTLQDTDIRVRAFCRATPFEDIPPDYRPGKSRKDFDRCPWTGETNLQSALAAVLMSREKAESLGSFTVHRHNNTASLTFGRPNASFASLFASSAPQPRSAIRISADIEAASIRRLAAFLQIEMAGSK
ncbi:hypothetical protein CT676_35990 [Bradyrhizobium sp. MOS001]|uniref:hypothetical protein n=1 Tax=unclassified Bradyrhizobium TaxID=2631580 RepID=UPI00107530FE|nr:hypothetical protein [Bradyrhizobium sp. MOS001]TFW56262.1 hypothetical protein CT676_35990 [Bradyrhizobium sp. MOS001]